MHPIVLGFGAGIAMSLMLGTVFFSIIQNSIRDSWKAGVKIALGVVVCDLFFLGLVLAGDSYIQKMSQFKEEIAIVGSVFLILLGIVTFFQKVKKEVKGMNTSKYLLNGFLLNFLNPVNFAFWVTLSTTLGSQYDYELESKMSFFSAAVVAIFLSESLISVGASKLNKWMTTKRLVALNRIVGLLFIGFGIRLLFLFIF